MSKTEREIVHDIVQSIFVPSTGVHCGPDGRYMYNLVDEYGSSEHSCHTGLPEYCPIDGSALRCVGCTIGGGSHYWTLRCEFNNEFRYDSYDWTARNGQDSWRFRHDDKLVPYWQYKGASYGNK